MPQNPDPLALLATDRQAAREAADPWAALCCLGTLDASGDVQQRTLVLRDLDGELALFFSATAPKWSQLRERQSLSLLLYLPSQQVQYRMQAGWREIDAATVHRSWQLRPDMPKKLDWLYTKVSQSSETTAEALNAALDPATPTPPNAPASAMGVIVVPSRIERLVLDPAAHHRVLYQKAETGWTEALLVP